MRTKLISLLTLLALVSACNWAPLSKPGKKVRVLELHEVSSCTKKGTTTVTTKDKVIGISRNEETIAEELIRLARNTAPDLNGDTIVAKTKVVDGKQTFTVYKCVDPNN